ncbi:TRAP transporter large permease [Agathobaculum massiliense]|uniref:TRAP transporter large permease n=1 Tax=Agathobaculum massiliense TaxID=3014267 RepID=UPI00131D7BAC|nr:TRAP transporter large permease [Agathobaculum massiliense]
MDFLWLFVFLIAFMALGVPVAISMLMASFIYMQMFDISFYSAVIQSVAAPMSQTLLAVGFFILAGNLMNLGGVTRRIFTFAQDVVGWIPGGLGHANVLASVIFAGMSGSATADAAGLGKIEVKAMTQNGYDKEFSAAITGASSVLGPIIPPSVPMILMATLTGVSTGRLFAAGILPGITCALILMIIVFLLALKNGYPRTPFPTARLFWVDLKMAFLPMMTPVLMRLSIYSGVFTPSEVAVFAGMYAICLGLITHELPLRQIPHIFRESAQLLCNILFIVVAAKVFGYVLTLERVPNIITEMMMSFVSSPTGCMIVIVIIMLIVGCIMDGTAAIFIVAPILYPVATSFGIDPIHFCMVFVFTLMVGVVTPPFGMVLFILQKVAKVDFGKLCKAMIPFFAGLGIVILLLAFVPQLSTLMPAIMYG